MSQLLNYLKPHFEKHYYNPLFKTFPGNNDVQKICYFTYGQIWEFAEKRADFWKKNHLPKNPHPNAPIVIIRPNEPQWIVDVLASKMLSRNLLILSDKLPPSIIQKKILSLPYRPLVLSKRDSLTIPSLNLDQDPNQDLDLYRDLHININTEPWDRSSPKTTTISLITSGSSSGTHRQEIPLSSKNLVFNLQQISRVTDSSMVSSNDLSFSILPWSHCYGMTCELFFMITRGACLWLPQNTSSSNAQSKTKMSLNNPLLTEMQSAQPSVLFTVPYMLDRILQSIGPFHHMFSSSRTSTIGVWGSQFMRHHVFGGNLQSISVGGAASDVSSLVRFSKIFGVSIYEGYGMTETSPMISLNTSQHYKLGSVGKPLPGVRILIHPDTQEILVRGPNVVSTLEEHRYLHTTDGKRYLRTGDRGRIDDDGFLFVEDRLSDHFKLKNGLYIYPQKIESLYLEFRPKNVSHFVVSEDPRKPSNLVLLGFLTYGHMPTHTISQDELVRIGRHGELQGYEIPRSVLYIVPEHAQTLLTEKKTPRRKEIKKYILSQIHHLDPEEN